MKLNKLSIAVVTALTTATLSVLPAQANTQTLTVAGAAANGGTTVATAIALPVPADTTVSASNVLSISISGLANGTTVSATATKALLVSTLSSATAASGSATLVVNASGSAPVELFVFTKTSEVGSITVSVNNTTATYYVKGTAGAVTKVGLAAPATGLAGSTQSVVVSAFDIFNNAKSQGNVNLVINTNGVITTTTVTTTASGTVSHVVTLPSTGSVTVTAFAASSSATAIIAVTQPRNVEAELATALAAVAKLTTDLATANTAKADADKSLRKLKWQYNTLVKKFNKGKPKAQHLAFIK
jgi:hypothetical protein